MKVTMKIIQEFFKRLSVLAIRSSHLEQNAKAFDCDECRCENYLSGCCIYRVC